MSKSYMSMNDELRKGDSLVSNNKEYKAIFQHDGNFVNYGWKPLWVSNTHGRSNAHRLCMQDDCNLVMYDRDNNAFWQSNTYTNDRARMCHFYLRDNGNLVIEKGEKEVWNSCNSNGMR